MAGTIDLVQRAYTGAEIRDGVLYFAPKLTDKLNGLSFPMQVHGTPIRVTLGDGELTVVITGGFSRAIKVGIGDDVRELGAGERCTFTLADPRDRRPGQRYRRGNMTDQQGFRGAIFDVDGVLVDSPHEAAWRDAFRELMETDWADIRDQTSWTPDAFTAKVYQEVLSGKPRMAGAMAALEFFGVPEPETRVDAYADHKQAMVVELIKEGKFSAYPDALRFLLAVKDRGIAVAAASSSKNAGLFLRQIRLDTFAEQEGLQYDWLEDGLTLLERLRRRHLRPRVRAGQAAPGDLPHRRPGARRRARRTRSSSRTPSRASRRPRPARSPVSAWPATTTRRCSPAWAPTSWSSRSTRSTSRACPEGRLERARGLTATARV